jgi:hypothetical protein
MLALGALWTTASCSTELPAVDPDAGVQTGHEVDEDEANLADRVSTSLVRWVEEELDLPRACVRLVFPTPGEAGTYRRGLGLLLEDRLAAGRIVLGSIGFEVLRIRDGGTPLYIVREPDHRTRGGWGVVVVNQAARRPLLLEAPHPVHDHRTGVQAAALLLSLQARALLLSTTYRCGSGVPTRCAGRTGACRQINNRGRYRVSDVAHEPRSAFHIAHVTLTEAEPELVAVQIHGFRQRPWRRHQLIFSDGTKLPGRRGNHSVALARITRRLLPRRRRRGVRSCNERDSRGYLCGTHNVQGRHANGSPDPCLRRPRRSLNRYVHVEQSRDARTPGGPFEPALLEAVLARRWPARPPRRRARRRRLPFPLAAAPSGGRGS